ncbi:allantoate amidohydrolase [Novosphingobium sp. Leaf2]|uniref:allantoate amidohydrolase n=1 Tax=Novosphingobium sp. Leaf2 TaxID=1735670 RepID=UPI0006F2BAE7|nr:allantoate amidohydrolase [Novosphingobium sp. Leaf2]KQM19708.1 Zn-dependent hydrolase [Novosphingobium sp. Leaf2]
MVTGSCSGGARAVARCDQLGLAPYSDMMGGLYRAYLTPAHRATVDQVGGWMFEAGMSARIDPAGNLVGHYPGARSDAPALIIGSHLDSVRDGGCYDGPLGVMLGIECVAALHAAGRRLPFAIDVYGFGDEEGSRFPAAMLSSRAVAGTLDVDLMTIADTHGVPLADALRDFNAADDDEGVMQILETAPLGIAGFHKARRRTGHVLAYLEAHIEQGPALEADGLAVGTVTGIAAQLRYRVVVTGMAGHAGTTTMRLRRDPLAGAAAMVLSVEQLARADNSDVVATVGMIEALPGAPNVIPGEVRFTIDVRSGVETRRDTVAEQILDRIVEIADARDLDFAIERIHDLPASPCDAALMDLMDAALVAAGQSPRRLVSGAGHDAMNMAALCPTAMLFIRCKGGISHNPAEHVDPADADIALQVMLGFIERLAAKHA